MVAQCTNQLIIIHRYNVCRVGGKVKTIIKINCHKSIKKQSNISVRMVNVMICKCEATNNKILWNRNVKTR